MPRVFTLFLTPYRAASLIILGLLILPIVAWAAGASAPPSPDTDAAEWIKALYAAYTDGQWKVFGGLISLGIVYVARRWGPKAFDARWWGYTLAIGTSLLATFGTALGAGADWSFGLVLSAVSTALTSVGLWEVLKDTGSASNRPKTALPA